MDDTEQEDAGQLITILSIWRDPSSDIGLNPRNNWCMQSQIGSPPKIWVHYFIRWSHIPRAKIICVSNAEIQILLVLIMLSFSSFFPNQDREGLSDEKQRATLNKKVSTSAFLIFFSKFNGLFVCVHAYLMLCSCVYVCDLAAMLQRGPILGCLLAYVIGCYCK